MQTLNTGTTTALVNRLEEEMDELVAVVNEDLEDEVTDEMLEELAEKAMLEIAAEEAAKENITYWAVQQVEENGDIIIRVFNREEQQRINALRSSNAADIRRQQMGDDRYMLLLQEMGFEALNFEMYSAAARSYVRNAKKIEVECAVEEKEVSTKKSITNEEKKLKNKLKSNTQKIVVVDWEF